MHTEHVAVAIIGGGPSGLGISHLLTAADRPNVVLEQARIGESWRNRRWDSLRLVGANWTLQLPGCSYDGDDPQGFMPKDEVVAFIEAYAAGFNPPVHEGVRVTDVEVGPGGRGFRVRTADAIYAADHVVVATGANRAPNIPTWGTALPRDVRQIGATEYRNPAALPPGAVLVVGSGESGCQIAEEVRRHGRAVYLSVGRYWWKPAWYRGRDNVWWKTRMGGHDRPATKGTAPSPLLTGQDGGRTLNLHTLARGGVSLLGRMDGIDGATFRFLPDVERQVAAADAAAARGIAQIDAFVAATGMDAPPDDSVRDPALWTHPDVASATALDMGAAGITTVIWATGYRLDFGWVRVPAFDEDGYPVHEAGVAMYEGLYFPALPGRDTFLGVVRDAAHIVESIVARTGSVRMAQ